MEANAEGWRAQRCRLMKLLGLILPVVAALLLVALIVLDEGCAVVPNRITPEIEHMSHASQHIGPNRTEYGSEIASVVLHWDLPEHVTLELAEGVDLDHRWPAQEGYGEILGPREEFTARIGYSFVVKP